MGIIVQKSEGSSIVEIIFDRPEKRNALDGPTLESFLEALQELKKDQEIKVIITSGAGNKAYTAGMDLHYLRKIQKTGQHWSETPLLVQAAETLRSLPQITISKIRGYCLGGGITLVAAHELAVTAQSSWFGAPEIIRGEFGKLTTASLFHSGLSPKKAFLMQLTGNQIDGTEAERLGLVTHVVPDSDLNDFTYRLASQISEYKRSTLEHAKIAAYLAQSGNLSEAFKTDALLAAHLRLHLDPLENVEEYLAKQHKLGKKNEN